MSTASSSIGHNIATVRGLQRLDPHIGQRHFGPQFVSTNSSLKIQVKETPWCTHFRSASRGRYRTA